jgi:hypothetical protein
MPGGARWKSISSLRRNSFKVSEHSLSSRRRRRGGGGIEFGMLVEGLKASKDGDTCAGFDWFG